MKKLIWMFCILSPFFVIGCQPPKEETKVIDAGPDKDPPEKPSKGFEYEPNEGNGKQTERTYSIPIKNKKGTSSELVLVFISKNYEKFEVQRVRYRFQCENQFPEVKLNLAKFREEGFEIEKGKSYTINPQSRYTLKISSDTSECERAEVALTARIYN